MFLRPDAMGASAFPGAAAVGRAPAFGGRRQPGLEYVQGAIPGPEEGRSAAGLL